MTIAFNQPGNRFGFYEIPQGLEERPAAKAVLSGEVYEPGTIDFICAHAGEGDIVHAGTFFGDFLPALSGAVATGRRVWAFEPNPTNYAAARRTVELNGLTNVTLTNAALSNRGGEIGFQTHDAKGAPLGGLSRVTDAPGPGVQHVPATLLDFAVPFGRPVSVLHLDVEGHEKQALKGAYHLINRWQPILVLEYFSKTRWLTRTFRDLEYRQIGRLHGNYVYATSEITLPPKAG